MILMLSNTVLADDQDQLKLDSAVNSDTLKNDQGKFRVKTNFFPVVFFLPETSLGFGGTSITTWRNLNDSPDVRPSQWLFGAAYTLKNQILLYNPYEIYWNNEQNRLQGEVGFYKYFFNYFGVGAKTDQADLEMFDVVFPRVNVLYSNQIKEDVFVGGGFYFDYFDIRSIKEGGLLDRNRPTGVEGGVKWNAALTFRQDKRDNILSPSTGYLLDLTIQHSIVPNYRYSRVDFITNKFIPIKPKWVWANDLWVAATLGDPPFFDMPYISTPKRARGFNDRRFINRNLVSAQSELRYPIYKRFRGTGFISATTLPDSWDTFNLDDYPVRIGYGLGLRYELDPLEKTRIRVDVARAMGTFNFYLTVNEAF